MKKTLLTLLALLATVGVSAQDLRLRYNQVYGDAMGQTANDVISVYDACFYNQQGQLLSKAHYGRNYATGIYELSRLTTYEYNAAGLITKTWSEQYGPYDGEDIAFKSNKDTTYYTYDDKGQIVSEYSEGYQRLDYTYSDEGYLVKKERYTYDAWTLESALAETTVYTEYDEQGRCVKVQNSGRWDSYNYTGVITYNADGNKVSELHYSPENLTLLKGAQYWTYDETGFCTMYEEKRVDENGVEADNYRMLYTKESENPLRIRRKSQSYFMDMWSNNATTSVEEYADYTGQQAPVLTLEKKESTAYNATFFCIELPAAVKSNPKAAVKLMDRARTMVVLPVSEVEADGNLHYSVTGLPNGYHEYMAQYVELDDDGKIAREWLVSNPVSEVHNTPLAAPTNLRVVGAEKDKYGDYSVTVAWDEPQYADDLKPLRYNVILKNFVAADNRNADGQALEWTLEGMSEEFAFLVQAVYPIGKANSDYLTVNPKDYVTVTYDARSITEQLTTFDDASVPAQKTVWLYGGDDTVMRRATYNVTADGTDELTEYVREAGADRTYNERGRLLTEAVWNEAHTQYVETTYTYDSNDFLTESTTTQNKVRSNGNITKTNLYQVVYSQTDDDEVLTGVRYDYNAAAGQWKKSANLVCKMMTTGLGYTPTAKILRADADSVFISAMPAADRRAGLAAFNIYCDGVVMAKGLSFLDDKYLVVDEYGFMLDWICGLPAPAAECEYIVQYVELDNNMDYRCGFTCAAPLQFTPATAIQQVETDRAAASPRYNLQGQRVGRNYRGIVIEGSKKFVQQ
ncbi:MAG: hypothetical protein HUK02_00140 [Bacteroidaceae bacterium]|nr:hypothetical protein [Bacteroidaceae bacterium]